MSTAGSDWQHRALEAEQALARSATAFRLLRDENAALRSRVAALEAEKLRDIEIAAEAYLRERDEGERHTPAPAGNRRRGRRPSPAKRR